MHNLKKISNFGACEIIPKKAFCKHMFANFRIRPMKLLHTSDWHIGHQLYGYDRLEEHRHFFDQLTEIAKTHRPDAMLVCGDIFDVSSPSASASRLFTDYILELHATVPDMLIVITSGNHDGASRTDINRNLWKSAGIHVIGSVKKVNGKFDFSDNIIRVGDKGTIVAVPYVNKAFMSFDDKSTPQEKQFFTQAAQQMSDNSLCSTTAVLMAHLTVDGFDGKGHKFGSIGNLDFVGKDTFPSIFDYVALGHIHRPQNLDKEGRIRYSGTPVAISFDEEFPHTVSIVEINKGSMPDVTEIEINQKRDLITFPSEPTSFKKAIKSLSKLNTDENCYIRLNVAQETDLPSDCEEQATNAITGKKCRYCTIKYQRISDRTPVDSLSVLTAEEFLQLNPLEIAQRFFTSKGVSSDSSERYLSLLSELENELKCKESL